MAETSEFFNQFLPNKLSNDPDLGSMGVSFRFDIEGAGSWTLDLNDGGSVTEGEGGSDDDVHR